MQRIRRGCLCWDGLVTRSASIFALVLLAQLAPVAHAQALNFFNNWFVTGDDTVAGVGLANTGGVGVINMTGVPCTSGMGPAAAIVPCSTVGAVPATPIAAFLYWQTVESTQAPAAVNGTFNGFPIAGTMLGSDSSSSCWVSQNQRQTLRVYRADVLRFLPAAGGILLGNAKHTVALGQGVSGNNGVLITEGASLVVIYRAFVPGKPLIMPYRSVVIYDGEFTLTKRQPMMSQTVAGFYQAASHPAGTMTQIVANGRGSPANLEVNGQSVAGVNYPPFVGAQGASWDNLTFPIALQPNASSVATTSQDLGGGFSCASWASIVTSTNVQDSDNDGLLDAWEAGGLHRNTQVSPATFGKCADYPQDPCVDLPAMGAKNGVQDIFVQIDWGHGNGDGIGGANGNGYHDHMPNLNALGMVANAFAAHNIAVHFDVGNNYQGLGLAYIVPYKKGSEVLAQGGSDLDESTLVCHDTGTQICDYHEPYPVLSFKLGFQSVRDGNSLLNLPGHFAVNRKDTHHYMFIGHALGGPFDLTGKPLNANPLSISGIADRPGGDIMITLGLWNSPIPANDQVGGLTQQAGTFMHELGHNLGLSHGGWTSLPQCMPNYPSVMSYLYQTQGLTDVNGAPQIDYSNGVLGPLIKGSLYAGQPLGTLKYRLKYYAPPISTDSPGQVNNASHCDGSPLNGESGMIRKEGSGLTVPDWSDGTIKPLGTVFSQDVNFDGNIGETLYDQPDWASLNLQQVGSRLNFGSVSNGSAATDIGSAATDIGSAATDLGSAATDLGSTATDLGSAATDLGSAATDLGDIDYETLIRTSPDGIPTPQQCAGCGLAATNGISSITLSWTPPATGTNPTYNIYRCAGVGCNPADPTNRISTGFMPASQSAPTFTDNVSSPYSSATCTTCYNVTYTYSVTAVPSGGSESGYSNTATSEITHLFVVADNQSIVYGSANPTPTFKVYGDVAGSLSGVSCYYTPTTPRNAAPGGAVYPITCTGPATTSTTDGVTYNTAYLTYVPGTLTIAQRPITVTAAYSSKTYDRTTTSMATPTITSAVGLAYSDSVAWTESYDNWNVGTTHVMTPAGTVNDLNSGSNYQVTFVNINTGVIKTAPLTITAQPNTKTYDGTTSAAAIPTFSGNIAPDSVTGLVEAYLDPNTGNGKTLKVTAYTVIDGNNGGNYTVSTATNTMGIINKANATVVVTPYNVTYDGVAHSATVVSITGVNGETGSTVGTVDVSQTTHTNAGRYSTDTWTFTGAANYNNINSTTTPAAPIFTDTINKANATVVVTPYSLTYDGLAHTATLVSITGVHGETGSTVGTVDVSSTTHTNAGTYSTDTWAFIGAANYNNINSTTTPPAPIFTDTISKANATVVVTPYSVPYNGLAHNATLVSITGVHGEMGGTVGTVDVSSTSHTNAGTYATDTWTFTGAANYNNINSTTTPAAPIFTDTISKVNAAVVVTAYSVTYDGLAHTANVVSITGVHGEMGSTVGAVDVSQTAHTNANTYSSDYWTFTGTANYNNIAATTVTDTIMAAAPVLPPTQSGASTYGTSVTLTVTISGTGSEEIPTGSVTFQFSNAGVTYDICADGTLKAQPPGPACSVTLDNTGTAKVTTTQLPAGTTADAITATYAPGDSNYTGGMTAINYTVAMASTQTTLGISPATAPTYGDTVTLSSTVSDNTSGSTGTPTRTVQFEYSTDGSTWINIGAAVTLDGTGKAQTTTTALPAGSPSIKAVYSGDADFTGSSSGVNSYPVNQKTLTVTGITANNKPYDGNTTATLNTAGEMLVGAVNSDAVTLGGTATGAFTPDANAGNSKTVQVSGLTLSGAANVISNYTLTQPTTTATIAQVALTVTAPSFTVTYGDPVPGPLTPNITGFVNGESSTVLTAQPACTTTYTPTSNAGSAQTTSCSGAAANNYSFTAVGTYVGGTVTVKQATATITVTPYSVPYDGNAHTANVVSITGVHGQTGSTVGTVDVSNTVHTNAGTYGTDYWTFTGTTNYNNIAATTIIDTIMAAAPVLPSTQSGASTYGTSVTLTVTISGTGSEEIPTGSVTFQFSNAGVTYDICADGTLKAQPPGPACSVTLDNTGTAKVTTTNLPAGTTADAITATYAPGDSNYTGGMTAINYTVAMASTQTTLGISPATAPTYGDTVTLSSTVSDNTSGSTGTPTGTVQFEYSTDGSTWINIGAAVTLDGTGKAQTTATVLPAGSPSIKAVYSGDADFTGSSSGVSSYPVNQKTLTVTGITANNKPYDGTTTATLTGSGTLVGIINSDPVTLGGTPTGTFTPDANAGNSKTVQVSGLTLSGAANVISNYTLTQPTTTANIIQVPLTVTAPSLTVTYGDPVPGPLTPNITGFVNGESSTVLTSQPSCTTTYTPTSNAGSAQTTSCSGGAANNYSFTSAGTYVSGTVTVKQATATITVTPYSVRYDGNPHTAAGTATGLGGLPISGLILTGTVHTNAGTYSGDAWSFSNTNYISAAGVVTDTIGQATASISVTGYTVTFDFNAHTAAGTATGVGTVDLSADLNLSGTTHTNTGNYSSDSWTFTDPNGNYAPANGSVSDTISTLYTQGGTLADFLWPTPWGQFMAIQGLGGDYTSLLPYTPTTTDVANGLRISGNNLNPPIVVQFPSPVSSIRVFPNIDHYGSAYDGYQYSIYGSNDNVNYTLLYDVTTVSGVAEPFTIGAFTGQPPFQVNNILTPGAGPGGTVGYIADFSFGTAYTYYQFGASTFAINSGNADQELTAVAALP